MSTNDDARQLHEKATRGVALTAEEQARLEQWYALQDQAEGAAHGQALPPHAVADLRGQVDAALAQLTVVTQRIQTLTDENEALRRETAVLQQQLAQRPVTHGA